MKTEGLIAIIQRLAPSPCPELYESSPHHYTIFIYSRDSSCGIGTVETAWVRFSASARDFSVLHSVHTGSGATLPPIQWVPGALSPGRETELSPASNAEVKNGGAIRLVLQSFPRCGAELIKYRDFDFWLALINLNIIHSATPVSQVVSSL
jgi:hypothetical protein